MAEVHVPDWGQVLLGRVFTPGWGPSFVQAQPSSVDVVNDPLRAPTTCFGGDGPCKRSDLAGNEHVLADESNDRAGARVARADRKQETTFESDKVAAEAPMLRRGILT